MDDLISRAVAKRAINNYKNSMIGLAPLEINRIVDLFQIILKLPSVDAVPVVHGQWVDKEFYAVCSVCGSHPWRGYVPSAEILIASEKYKYCPTCGAKMDDNQREATKWE